MTDIDAIDLYSAIISQPAFPLAPCRVEPDRWFPSKGDDAREAKEACRHCPYRRPCLAGAKERKERHGIWGGVAIGRRYKLNNPARTAQED